MAGVGLLLLTLAYGLTGYLLPWDNRAYWGTVVTTQIAGQAPVLGPYLTRLLGGGGAVGVVTFARFYGMHVLLLPPATLFLIVWSTINALQVFDEIYVTTRGGPLRATTVLVYELYDQAFNLFHGGYAAAIAYVLFMATLVLTLIQLWIGRRTVHYSS